MIYADNSATTSLSPTALSAMMPYLQEAYGNPSSAHGLGRRARHAIDEARRDVARALDCKPDQVVFTSGGTEADNLAIASLAAVGDVAGKRHAVASAFEHPAVLRPVDRLRQEGWDVTLVDAGKDGIVSAASIESALRDDTAFVALMAVNNEIGTVQPVDQVAQLCRERAIAFHADAVQAVAHIPVSVKDLGVDSLALSAHKFRGPKGIGALIWNRDLALQPLILGGGQERGLRAGTENVAGIVGLAAALKDACEHMEDRARRERALAHRLVEGLSEIPDARHTAQDSPHAPGIVHFCFKGVDAQMLIIMLDGKGICASAGSACSAGALTKSHVLAACGIDDEWARGALRLSISSENTIEEIDTIIEAVRESVQTLRGDAR